jgi:hypothetical protein
VFLLSFRYQNGNLVTDFYDPKKTPNAEYTNSVLYSKLSQDEMPFFIKVCNAFENFIAYLSNADVVIDYTYLWDIICTPNPALFKEGINLVILEVANNDITDNVNLICPTNHYNSVIYDPVKPTLILFHQDEYFEPIYTYKTEKNPKSKELLRLAFRLGDPKALNEISNNAASTTLPPSDRIFAIELLGQLSDAKHLPTFLKALEPNTPDNVRLAAINAMQSSADDAVALKLLDLYPTLPGSLKSKSLALLSQRPTFSLLLMQLLVLMQEVIYHTASSFLQTQCSQDSLRSLTC